MKKNIAILTLFILVLVPAYFIINNHTILFTIVSLTDKPSKLHYLSLERIYKLAESNAVRKNILDKLIGSDNKNLHNYYIYALGISGEKKATDHLILLYNNHSNNDERKSTQNYIIDSLGLIGTEKSTNFLHKLLVAYDINKSHISSYRIARALYLSSGKTSYFYNMSRKKQLFNPTNELVKARNLILASQVRARTYEEMLALDNLFRPPAWKQGQ